MSFQNKLFKYESKLNNLQKGGSPLIDAILANNLDEVRRLLTINPVRVNEVIRGTKGNTYIFFARSVEMLKLLIEFGSNIDVYNTIPLLIHFASMDLHELVIFLVNYGADLVSKDFSVLDTYIYLTSNNGNSLSYYPIIKYKVYNPIIPTVYKLLLNKGAIFNTGSLRYFRPHTVTSHEYDINELNLRMKNDLVLPALATLPEAFNIDYVRVGHPTVKWYQYLKEAYNITEDEILAMATKMALERRMPAALSQRRYLKEESIRIADDTAAASAPPSPPSAPPNAGAGTGP